MSNTKIFGEEHFIDNRMVELIEAKNKAMDNIVFNEMEKSINITLPFVKVNAEKLRNWVLLCIKLENIDKSDLVECAVRKKFADKDNEISKLKAELEELKENSIVPKFKIGETLFFVTNIKNKTIKSTNEWCYVLDKEGLFIETNNLPYDNYFYDYTFDRVFATKEQAEEALKKLEGKQNGK